MDGNGWTFVILWVPLYLPVSLLVSGVLRATMPKVAPMSTHTGEESSRTDD